MLGKITIWLASVAKGLVAIGILVIVPKQLMSVDLNVEFTADKQAISPHYSCLMSADSSNPGICNYAMAAASISLLVSAAVSLLQCVTCDLCGCGGVLDFVLGAAGTGWWIAASMLLKRNVDAANAASVPNQTWRDRVVYMAYAEVVLFGIICVVTLLQAMNVLCCKDKKKEEYSKV